MFAELSLATGLFLLSASFLAGFVDSIAGGGGIVQLPALLIGLPNSPAAEVLGTNKLSAVFGTTTAAALYRKQIKPDPRVLLGMAIPAFFGSAAGALLASRIPTSSMRPNDFSFADCSCDLYMAQARSWKTGKSKTCTKTKNSNRGHRRRRDWFL